MLNRIVVSKNQDPDISIIYNYEFKSGIDIENAENHCGTDMRDEVYKILLQDFKDELYSKIYKVDKLILKKYVTP